MKRRNEGMRDELIRHAREIYEQDGIDAINIRNLARQSNVALGTIYNYFSGKEEILLAITEEYWQTAFEEMMSSMPTSDFISGIEYMLNSIHTHINAYGMPLMYSLKNNGAFSKNRMLSMQNEYKNAILKLLEEDHSIREDIWNDDFTKNAFTGFVINNILILLKADKAQISFFLNILKSILY